jgi:hypothetical protein
MSVGKAAKEHSFWNVVIKRGDSNKPFFLMDRARAMNASSTFVEFSADVSMNPIPSESANSCRKTEDKLDCGHDKQCNETHDASVK